MCVHGIQCMMLGCLLSLIIIQQWLQSQVLSPQLRVSLLFLIFLCHSSRHFHSSRVPILLFLVLHHHQQTGIFPPAESLPPSLSSCALLPATTGTPHSKFGFYKLVVVFAHKHPKEWPFLVYSKFHCFLLSLFSIFSQFLDIYSCFIYLTSPTTSNVSLIYVPTNFVMNFLNLFPHIVLHTL